MRFFYSLSIRFYYFAVLIASAFNNKAKKWIKGRKNLLNRIDKVTGKSIWIHAASLGEFEQGRPIIESLKNKYPDKHIHLSFFSPSGYEIRKQYDYVDSISYLPLDTKSNAKRIIDKINPEVVIFIKYEYWYNLFSELKYANIKIILASAILRKNQIFFKPYGSWFKKQLQRVDMFFTQDENSTELLNSIGIANVKTAGDTRFDRVAEVASNPKNFDNILEFSQDKTVILAGSTWPKDEENILKAFKEISKKSKLIIAPHNVDEKHINDIVKLFADFKIQMFSNLNESKINETEVLIIDSIGILLHLYQYADFAYIGGGFGAGIHNILEAATFGKAVIFGPNYHKFNEANDLIKLKTAFTYKTAEELTDIFINLLNDKEYLKEINIKSKNYIENKKGAVNLIVSYIQSEILQA